MDKHVYTYPDGSKYEGEMKDGRRHGRGIWVRADGLKYEGEWEDDKPSGKGKLITLDGKICIGEWSAGKLIKNMRPVKPQEEKDHNLEEETQELKEEIARLKQKLAELEKQRVEDNPYYWEDEDDLLASEKQTPEEPRKWWDKRIFYMLWV